MQGCWITFCCFIAPRLETPSRALLQDPLKPGQVHSPFVLDEYRTWSWGRRSLMASLPWASAAVEVTTRVTVGGGVAGWQVGGMQASVD